MVAPTPASPGSPSSRDTSPSDGRHGSAAPSGRRAAGAWQRIRGFFCLPSDPGTAPPRERATVPSRHSASTAGPSARGADPTGGADRTRASRATRTPDERLDAMAAAWARHVPADTWPPDRERATQQALQLVGTLEGFDGGAAHCSALLAAVERRAESGDVQDCAHLAIADALMRIRRGAPRTGAPWSPELRGWVDAPLADGPSPRAQAVRDARARFATRLAVAHRSATPLFVIDAALNQSLLRQGLALDRVYTDLAIHAADVLDRPFDAERGQAMLSVSVARMQGLPPRAAREARMLFYPDAWSSVPGVAHRVDAGTVGRD